MGHVALGCDIGKEPVLAIAETAMRAGAGDVAKPGMNCLFTPSMLALSQSELRLLNFVQWKGSRPPTTVYLRPVLAELRSWPRRPPGCRRRGSSLTQGQYRAMEGVDTSTMQVHGMPVV